MKKFLLPVFAVLLMQKSYGQCNGRYVDQLFSTVTKTTVVYSSVYNLSMDIYTPDGDTVTNRPVILLAHGGSFTGGSRAETTLVELCNRFAKRGYVTASMSYRLASSAFDMVSESTAYPVVMKAISDGKAAVRYLKLNADTYGIDSNRVIVGGNSAGAILMLHLVYIDSVEEAGSNQIIQNAIIANGGIEGNSGNPGPTSKTIAIVDWAGGIKDTAWMSVGNPPVVNLHGDPDGTVPYNCGQVLGGFSQVSVCGPGVYNTRLSNVGINFVHKRFANGDHQPWGSSGTGNNFNLSDSITTAFLYDLLCAQPSSVENAQLEEGIIVFPNPAHNEVTIQTTANFSSLVVYDLSGRVVSEVVNINNNRITIPVSSFVQGMYLIKLQMTDGQLTKKILVK